MRSLYFAMECLPVVPPNEDYFIGAVSIALCVFMCTCDGRLSASSSKLVTLKSAGNSAIGTARAASSSAREALRLERDHLRRLTAELLELYVNIESY